MPLELELRLPYLPLTLLFFANAGVTIGMISVGELVEAVRVSLVGSTGCRT